MPSNRHTCPEYEQLLDAIYGEVVALLASHGSCPDCRPGTLCDVVASSELRLRNEHIRRRSARAWLSVFAAQGEDLGEWPTGGWAADTPNEAVWLALDVNVGERLWGKAGGPHDPRSTGRP